MAPLIEIKNVPIEIEMKISQAKLEYTSGSADLEISRGNKGVQIKSKPIQVNVDTFESRNAVMPTTSHSIDQHKPHGKQGTYEATASFSKDIQQLLVKAKFDSKTLSMLDKPKSLYSSGIESEESKKQSDMQPPYSEMNIRFEMDKLNFDWRMSAQEFEFTPGTIEFSVSQQPDVIITYVGGPIYVPPSSDPDYEPVDVKA